MAGAHPLGRAAAVADPALPRVILRVGTVSHAKRDERHGQQAAERTLCLCHPFVSLFLICEPPGQELCRGHLKYAAKHRVDHYAHTESPRRDTEKFEFFE